MFINNPARIDLMTFEYILRITEAETQEERFRIIRKLKRIKKLFPKNCAVFFACLLAWPWDDMEEREKNPSRSGLSEKEWELLSAAVTEWGEYCDNKEKRK